MIKIMTIPGCARCRRVKSWFKENGIPYTEENLTRLLLDSIKLGKTLSSVHIPDFCDLPACSASDAIERLQASPSRMKRPVVLVEPSDLRQYGGLLEDLLQKNWFWQCPSNCSQQNICEETRLNKGSGFCTLKS